MATVAATVAATQYTFAATGTAEPCLKTDSTGLRLRPGQEMFQK